MRLFICLRTALLLPAWSSAGEKTDVADGVCTGASCANATTDSLTLLQRAKLESSTILPLQPAEAAVADQETARIVAEEVDHVMSSLAIAKQKSMVQDLAHRAAAEAVEAQSDSSEEMALPFAVPFDTSGYTDKIDMTSTEGGTITGACAYYRIDDDHIYLGLAANSGYVGFGMNPVSPSMRNADIVVCREYTMGTVSAADYYATANAAPQLDALQDWTTLQGGRVGASSGRQVTWCEIRRPRKTCEDKEDYQAISDTATLFGLIAFAQPSATTDQLSYHGDTQRKAVTFRFKEASAGALPDDAQVFTLTAPDVTVPSDAGSYVCAFHILPIDKDTKFHIVNFKAQYDWRCPAARARVQHHINLNACTQAIPGANDGDVVPCSTGMRYCSEAFLASAEMYSPKGHTLPDDAGMAIGDGFIYVMTSRHFYNPRRKLGLIDSGTQFKITYTPTLRPNNLGFIILVTTHIKVPAKTSVHVVRSWCPSACTSRLQGTTTITQVSFHMHYAGIRTKLRHIRNGQELEPIGEVDPWDQAAATFPVNRVIVPGDDLILECVYTNPKDGELKYGESLTDEMCVGTLVAHSPGSLKMCADLPWGIQTIPKACYYSNGKIRKWPHCKLGVPMTYCPNKDNYMGHGVPTKITASQRQQKFVEYDAATKKCNKPGGSKVLVPAVPGSCVAPAIYNDVTSKSEQVPTSEDRSDRSDESSSDLTAQAAQTPGVILGEVDCGMGERAYKVSWATNCNEKSVTFELEANGGPEWMALGLLDGGAAASSLPAGRVNKLGNIAGYVTGESSNGKSYVKFVRPFNSSDGLSLTEAGFVYMVCVANYTKQTITRHIPTRISLFGGLPEYYNLSFVTKTTTPDPNQGWRVQNFTRCRQAQPKSLYECSALAANANVPFKNFKQINKKDFPQGCFFFRAGMLFVNRYRDATGGPFCSDKAVCICKEDSRAAFMIDRGPCPDSTRLAKNDCKPKADELKASYNLFQPFNTARWPAGCFLYNGKLWFNEMPDSTVLCGHKGAVCICGTTTTTTTTATTTTTTTTQKLDSEPEPETEVKVPYLLDSGTCPESKRVAKDDCEARADELRLIVNNFKTIKSLNHPAYCFLSHGVLFFNEEDRYKLNPVPCGKRSLCLCAGAASESEPEPEPEPEPESESEPSSESEPAPETLSYHIKFAIGTCAKRVPNAEACKEAAETLQYRYTSFESDFSENDWPTGCFAYDGKLWYNTMASDVQCNKLPGHLFCFCGKQPELTTYPYYKSVSGTCAKSPSAQACFQAAEALKYQYTLFTPDFAATKDWPLGCFAHNDRLWYNTAASSNVQCDKNPDRLFCLCEEPESEPEPEPEPEPELYHKTTTGTCAKSVSSAQACFQAAEALKYKYTVFKPDLAATKDWPVGCFAINDMLWYNTAASSSVQCDKNPTRMFCLCKKEPVAFCSAKEAFSASTIAGQSCVVNDAPVGDSNFGYTQGTCNAQGGSWVEYNCQTAADHWTNTSAYKDELASVWRPLCCIGVAEPEQPGNAPYLLDGGLCPEPRRVPNGDCKARADELKLIFRSFRTINNVHRPADCSLSHGVLFFNEKQDSLRLCGKQSLCICGGAAAQPAPTAPSYHKKAIGTCDTSVQSARACVHAAEALRYNYTGFSPGFSHKDWPSGCFGFNGALWFNSMASDVQCDKDPTKLFCLCKKEPVYGTGAVMHYLAFDGSFLDQTGNATVSKVAKTNCSQSSYVAGVRAGGSAFHFANGCQVQLENPNHKTTEWSLSFWFKPDSTMVPSTSNSDRIDWLYGSRHQMDCYVCFHLTMNRNGNTNLKFYHSAVEMQSPTFEAGKWHHVFFTQTANAQVFYMNGEVVSQVQQAAPSSAVVGRGPFKVGPSKNQAAMAIDELIFYNRGFGADEVQQIMHQEGGVGWAAAAGRHDQHEADELS